MVKKIDGHVHFHYPMDSSFRNPSSDIQRIKQTGRENGVEEFLGIFRRKDLGEVERFLEDCDIHPGIYVNEEDDKESLEDFADKFEFAKIHPSISLYPSIDFLDGKIEESVGAGFDSIQVHMDRLSSEFLDTVEKYSQSRDMNLYLVHGAGALYGLASARNPDDVERLEGMKERVFLGTSSPRKSFMSGYLEKAVDDFENQLVYESDITPTDKEFWYPTTIEEVENSSADPEKVFYGNVQDFIG